MLVTREVMEDVIVAAIVSVEKRRCIAMRVKDADTVADKGTSKPFLLTILRPLEILICDSSPNLISLK